MKMAFQACTNWWLKTKSTLTKHLQLQHPKVEGSPETVALFLSRQGAKAQSVELTRKDAKAQSVELTRKDAKAQSVELTRKRAKVGK